MTGAGVFPLHLADVRIPEGDPRSGKPFPVVAHAVAHRDGVFLFDTGIGTGNAEIDEVFAPLCTLLQDALAVHGIAMADVTAVANCHLHFDHSGQNALFPGRPIFAQEREFRMVYEPNYTVPEWIDVPGLSYELLDGEAGVAPGLRLIPTPGHTPGHQSVVVETDGGTVVLAGQSRAVDRGVGGRDRSRLLGPGRRDGPKRLSPLGGATARARPRTGAFRARPGRLEARRVGRRDRQPGLVRFDPLKLGGT